MRSPATRLEMPQTLANETDYAALFAAHDTFLLDCDGVIWEGDTVLPGVHEALAHFRAQGKQLRFVTNNATKSRQENMLKFKKLGVECHLVRCVTPRAVCAGRRDGSELMGAGRDL